MTWVGGRQRRAAASRFGRRRGRRGLVLLCTVVAATAPVPANAADAPPRDQPAPSLEPLWQTFPLREGRERAARPPSERPPAQRRTPPPPAARRAETTPLPRPATTAPRSAAPTPRPATTTPRPAGTTRHPAGTTPRPAGTTPRPATTTPHVTTAPAETKGAPPTPPPRRVTTTPSTTSTTAGNRTASPPPLAPEPGGSGGLPLPLVGIVGASLLALAGLLALAWRFVWADGFARGLESRVGEIGVQVLVAILVSAVVGWLIATRFPV